MPASCEAPFESDQESAFALELEGDFGYEGEVDVLARHRGPCGQKAGVAAHDFHQGNTVLHAACFSVRTLQYFLCLLDGGEIPKCARYKGDIIVDGFGDS